MSRKKILVCDDDQDILDLVEIVLSEDYEVKKEIDSTQLIRRVGAFRPDLILLDMWMPKIQGDQLTQHIKSNQELRDIPVVVFSASKDGNDKALAAGADGFIAKPFDIDAMRQLVGYHCSTSSGKEK